MEMQKVRWDVDRDGVLVENVNQSINLYYIRQPKPMHVVARPIHIKGKKRKTRTTQYKYYHTTKREKRETKPLLERDICCRR